MTCIPAVILTSVQALGDADLRNAPVATMYMTVEVAAALTGIARKTIRNDLSEHKDRFDPPAYRSGKGRRWGQRLISARDLETLRSMYPIVSSYK